MVCAAGKVNNFASRDSCFRCSTLKSSGGVNVEDQPPPSEASSEKPSLTGDSGEAGGADSEEEPTDQGEEGSEEHELEDFDANHEVDVADDSSDGELEDEDEVKRLAERAIMLKRIQVRHARAPLALLTPRTPLLCVCVWTMPHMLGVWLGGTGLRGYACFELSER